MKTMKRFGCLLLVLAMVLALGVTAMAAPQTLAHTEYDEEGNVISGGSITINGAIANETYTIYQIFELTYSDDSTVYGDSSSYSYKVCEGWKDFLAEQTVNVNGNNENLFTLTNEDYLDPESLVFSIDYDMAAMARAALAYAEDEKNGITGTGVSYTYDAENDTATLNPQGVATIDNINVDENGYVTGELTFSSLSLGYYLVGTSLGSLCMLDSTDPDAVVNEKNSTPTISKWVYNTEDGENEHEDHEDNGTQVTYELDVEHITGAVNLVIHDSQPSELHEDWNTFAPTVTLVGGETRTKLSAGNDYKINLTGADADNKTDCSDSDFNDTYGCTFEIDFTGYDFSNVSDSAYIEVIYTATLETEGDIYVDDVDEIDNWAVVTFGAASSSPAVEAEVYSFGFEIFKYTDAGDDGMDVITVSVYNDSPGGQQDRLYLALVLNRQVTYYAEFAGVEGYENTYYITNLIEASRAHVVQEAPFEIIGYDYDEESGTWSDLSYITEPDASVTDDNPITLTFYFDGELPEHNYIVLDEFGTAYDEDDIGDEAMIGVVSNALPGAVFSLTNASEQTAYFLEEQVELTDEDGNGIGTKHIYLFKGWLDGEGEVPYGCTTELVSDDTGYINIEGLNTGTYTLTEVAAPDGYNLLDGSISVTITADYDSDTGALESHGVSYTYNGESDTGVVYVLNNAGSKLPGTGGIGTTIFYVIGAILVCGAVVLLVTKRRTSNKDQAKA